MYYILHSGVPSNVREQKTGKWDNNKEELVGDKKKRQEKRQKSKADLEVHVGKKG